MNYIFFTAVQDPVLNNTKTSIDYMRNRGPLEVTSSGAFFDHRAVSTAASKTSSKSNTANTGDFTTGSNNSSSDIIAKLTKEMLLSDSAAAASAAAAAHMVSPTPQLHSNGVGVTGPSLPPVPRVSSPTSAAFTASFGGSAAAASAASSQNGQFDEKFIDLLLTTIGLCY